MATTKKKSFKDRLVSRFGSPVNSGVGLTFGVAVVATSGIFAVRAGNLDQGQLVTLAEVRISQKQEAERIKNDPKMPPQAKIMALRYLGRGLSATPPPAPEH